MSSDIQPTHRPSLTLALVFLMWGFITVVNGFLLTDLVTGLNISLEQVQVLAYLFFATYLVLGFPAGKLIDKIGYKRGISIGLFVTAAGAALLVPAALLRNYTFVVASYVVMGAGITILQVGANPYVALLAERKLAASRLNFHQAFNSFGTWIAPLIGMVIVSIQTEYDPASQTFEDLLQAQADKVIQPYLVMAAMMVLLGLVFAYSKLPEIRTKGDATNVKNDNRQYVLQYKHLVLGAVAIFAYVGAEVSIGMNLIGYFEEKNINLGVAGGFLVAFYWGGAMAGRFLGATLLRDINPGKAVAFCGLMAALLVGVSVLSDGNAALLTILAVGLFNSILFPTIFCLGIDGLGKFSEEGSSVMIMAIVGGAVVLFVVNTMADSMGGYSKAFLLPLVCYLYVAYYGLRGHKYSKIEA